MAILLPDKARGAIIAGLCEQRVTQYGDKRDHFISRYLVPAALTTDIYLLTRKEAFSKDFGLRDQIQRASVSISSNIAEGDERGSNKESIRFFHIAKASAAEVITHLNIAFNIGYIDQTSLEYLESKTEKIRAGLKNLIKARTL